MRANQDICELISEEMGVDNPQQACGILLPEEPAPFGSPVENFNVIDRPGDTLVCGPKNNKYAFALEGGVDVPIPGLRELGNVRGDVSVNQSGFECERFRKVGE